MSEQPWRLGYIILEAMKSISLQDALEWTKSPSKDTTYTLAKRNFVWVIKVPTERNIKPILSQHHISLMFIWQTMLDRSCYECGEIGNFLNPCLKMKEGSQAHRKCGVKGAWGGQDGKNRNEQCGRHINVQQGRGPGVTIGVNDAINLEPTYRGYE